MTDVASYRVQFRAGMDFAALEERLDAIAGLGASHLYLSPILTATPGSTHGYDVTDPTGIDPALGGREGFERLSRAAAARGLDVILDIVPNHMAFGLESPWILDVLRHGPESPRARIFDIDWSAGPLALPWLTRPLAEAAAAGGASVADGRLHVDGLALPLAPGSAAGVHGRLGAEAALALEARQHWRLLPWPMERDSITHRRFFSITGLIGVRVEDPEVFETVHAVVIDLAEAGLIQGLRVDHVDGLADPAAYLERLAARLPGLPVWVEKILVTGEALPDWPVAGTTGYEMAALIGRMLTEPAGVAALDALWRGATGIEGDFHAAVAEAKREVLTDELAAELNRLRELAAAAAEATGRPVGPEMLREAITELVVAFPRYRSYISDRASAEDASLWRGAAARAAANVRSAEVVDWLAETVIAAETPEARRLAERLQQITGALLAKAHEDTAGFRFNRYLAANEVGADPDLPTVAGAAAQAALAERLVRHPRALNAGSSHDTKRSEDSRARIVATSHAPEAFAALWQASTQLPGTEAVDPNRRFYALQSALAIHGEAEAAERLGAHLVKAMREEKVVSYWTAPDEDAERRLVDWAEALLDDWDARRPAPLLRLVRIGAALSLREVVLRCLAPGMPDIYQDGERALLQLTDPDNRRRAPWPRPEPAPDTLDARKLSLLTTLLRLRRADPGLFADGAFAWETGRDGSARLVRFAGARRVEAAFLRAPPEEEALWSDWDVEAGLALALRAQPDTRKTLPARAAG